MTPRLMRFGIFLLVVCVLAVAWRVAVPYLREAGGAERAASIEKGRKVEIQPLADRSTLPQGMPDGFPVPQGTVSGQRDASDSQEGKQATFTLSTYADIADVADWYAAALNDTGWKVTISNVHSDGGGVFAQTDQMAAAVYLKVRNGGGNRPITDALVAVGTR